MAITADNRFAKEEKEEPSNVVVVVVAVVVVEVSWWLDREEQLGPTLLLSKCPIHYQVVGNRGISSNCGLSFAGPGDHPPASGRNAHSIFRAHPSLLRRLHAGWLVPAQGAPATSCRLEGGVVLSSWKLPQTLVRIG